MGSFESFLKRFYPFSNLDKEVDPWSEEEEEEEVFTKAHPKSVKEGCFPNRFDVVGC